MAKFTNSKQTRRKSFNLKFILCIYMGYPRTSLPGFDYDSVWFSDTQIAKWIVIPQLNLDLAKYQGFKTKLDSNVWISGDKEWEAGREWVIQRLHWIWWKFKMKMIVVETPKLKANVWIYIQLPSNESWNFLELVVPKYLSTLDLRHDHRSNLGDRP